jgi:hypothetical protein
MPKADSNSPNKTRCSDFGAPPAFAKTPVEQRFRTKTTVTSWGHQPRLQANTRAWLAQSPINEHVSGYCSYLHGRRYAEYTRRVYVCCVAHFARWMRNQGVNLRSLAMSTIERFLSNHLPRCGCANPVRKGVHDHRAALKHFLKVLQENGAITRRQRPLSSVDREVAAFDQYMEQTRGLARNMPRIHDLRHTFICRRVKLWHEQSADIDNAMVALSTYVGHAKVSDTYWYLTGVPELMAVAGRRFEQFASNLENDLA